MLTRYSGLPNEEKAWLGPLWMLRARMAFFVSNLAFYLQVSLTHHFWSITYRAHGTILATLVTQYSIRCMTLKFCRVPPYVMRCV